MYRCEVEHGRPPSSSKCMWMIFVMPPPNPKHGIHAVFPPTSVTHHTDGKEPILAKKLAAGDGNFDTKKEMIGFVFDGLKRTVHLPPAKAAAYIKETHTLLRQKTVPLKKLQMLVGKLRHASIILLLPPK